MKLPLRATGKVKRSRKATIRCRHEQDMMLALVRLSPYWPGDAVLHAIAVRT